MFVRQDGAGLEVKGFPWSTSMRPRLREVDRGIAGTPSRRLRRFLIAYRHGLRASELVAPRWDDIDFTTGKLHVHRAKGGMASVHPIGGKELRALRRLQRETPEGLGRSTSPCPSAWRR